MWIANGKVEETSVFLHEIHASTTGGLKKKIHFYRLG